MKKVLIHSIGRTNSVKMLFIAGLLIFNWGCGIKNPQLNMRGIDKVSHIQFDDVAVNEKETVPITATFTIETQSGIPQQYESQLKEKIKKPLLESLNRSHVFSQINDGSLGNSASDVTIHAKYSYENQAYDDVGYMPLALLTLLIVTPSHVVTQGTADVIIQSKFSRESMQDKFTVEGEGWTTTGIAGHGDALAKAIEKVTPELIRKSLDFIANNTNYYQKISGLKKENKTEPFASREDRGAPSGEAAVSQMGGDLSVWEPYKKDNTIEGYQEFMAAHPNNSYRAEAAARMEDLRAYQQAKSSNTLPAYAEFLRAQPSSSCRKEALAAMCLLIKKQKDPDEGFKKFIVEYNDGIEFVPPRHRLALIGPEGMRVADIHGLLAQGIDDKVIAAKIRMQNAVYKDFDVKELVALKEMGITSVLVEAMLDSTTRAKHEQEELRKKKEMEDLLAEIQQTQKKLDSMRMAQEQQQSQPQASAPQSSGPTVADTVKNCAAQIAALEACKHLPWPASTVCAATAKSQFPCE